MNRTEIALNKFKEGYNCAQSVVYSHTDALEISSDAALKLSNGFGAGFGRKQEICGAISGGVIVLSLLHGRGVNDDKQKQEITYAKVRELLDKFEAKHGTISCRRLLDGCELMTAEGQARFKSERMSARCESYINTVMEILDDARNQK